MRALYLIPFAVMVALCPTYANAQAAPSDLLSSVATPHSMKKDQQTPPLASPPDTNTNSPPASIPIPPWLSGTWVARSEIILYSYNCVSQHTDIEQPVTISITRESSIGNSRDANGQIWHRVNGSYARTIATKAYIESQQIKRLQLVPSAVDELKVQCGALVTRLSPDGSEFIDSFWEETTTTYTPLQDGLIAVTFAISDFDLNGKPLKRSRAICVEKRVRPFR